MGARSNGCLTCKARRVRCDETRPLCDRCSKARVACRGYIPGATFIDEKPRIERSLEVKRAQQEGFELARVNNFIRTAHRMRQPQASPGLANALSKEIPLTAFANEICTSFLASKIFGDRPNYHGCKSIVLGTHTSDTAIWWLDDASKQSQKALSALGAMFFGRANGSREMTRKAIGLYGDSIAELRTHLLDPNTPNGTQALLYMTLLCMYELTGFREAPGWTMHATGIGRLVESRGPELYKKFPEKAMFLEHRSILISKAILMRERTFLSESIWKTVPWEDDPGTKMPAEYILDILSDVAGVLADSDRYSSLDHAGEDIELSRRTQLLIEALNAWWRYWVDKHPAACQEHFPSLESTSTRDSEGLLFPSLLRFSDVWDAHAVCLYNIARILLLHIWINLPQQSVPDATFLLDEANDTPLLGISSDIKGLAHEIVRAYEYCHDDSRRFVGTFCIILPQDIAYECLDPNSREARFLFEFEPAVSLGLSRRPVVGIRQRLAWAGPAVLPEPWRKNANTCCLSPKVPV